MRHPFFNPLWRRVVTVLVCILWGLFELANGAVAWATMFIGIGLFAGWVFFFDWHHVDSDEDR